jgi:beta-phosphoglucomutase
MIKPPNKSHQNSSLPAAAIFDMDGVLVDSNPFHLEKWIEFLNRHHVDFREAELPKLILGQRNDTALRYFLGQDLSKEECRALEEELESAFRVAFKAHAKPLPGLLNVVLECKVERIPMAVASSAMRKNVDFVVDALGFRDYFSYVVSGDEVSIPKPDPEIYLKAAQQLGFDAAHCVAFEDSFIGIESAKSAGMKCVAIASSFPVEELGAQTDADLAVRGFKELNVAALRGLFPSNSNRHL